METSSSPPSPWGRPSSQASRDWARRGHADAMTLAPVLQNRPVQPAAIARAVPRVSVALRRTAGTIVLTVVALVAAGSALTLRDALFPTIGDATTRSVWQNPGQTPLPPAPSSPSTAIGPTTTTTTTPTTTTESTGTTGAPVDTADVGFDSTTPASGQSATERPRSTTPSSGTAVDDDDDHEVDEVDANDDDADDEPDSSGSEGSGSGSSGGQASIPVGSSGAVQTSPPTTDDDSSGSSKSGSGSGDDDSSRSGKSGSGSGSDSDDDDRDD